MTYIGSFYPVNPSGFMYLILDIGISKIFTGAAGAESI